MLPPMVAARTQHCTDIGRVGLDAVDALGDRAGDPPAPVPATPPTTTGRRGGSGIPGPVCGSDYPTDAFVGPVGSGDVPQTRVHRTAWWSG